MSRPQYLLLVAIALIVVCSASGYSQQNSSTPEDAQATSAALREKAFDLLISLAGQVNGLQSAENRARLRSNIAGSLWPHDEKRARALLVAVEEDIRTGFQNRESDDPRDTHTLQVFLRLREDTVERIAKHDAELALEFLKSTEPALDKPLSNEVEEKQRALELRLARELSSTNPEIALRLAKQSLARGLSHDLLALLRQLARKHKAQSQLLFKEIVNKIRNANILNDWTSLYFVRDLAQSFTPPLADESTFRELSNVLTTTALANGCGSKTPTRDNVYFCREIASLVIHMERTDPAHAAQLKHWATEDRGPTVTAGITELNDLFQNGTLDEILALVPKYPQLESEIYRIAIEKLMSSGDVEQARKIATNFTGDVEIRRRLLSRIEGAQTSRSMNEQQMAEVQRVLNTIPGVTNRIQYLFSIALPLGVNDQKAALGLLDQAAGIINTIKPGKEQTQMQMGLAVVYCVKKSEQGWAIMESLVPQLNELVEAAAKLDRYDNRYLRDGEWNMTGEGGVGSLLTMLAHNAGHFAWCDFDRAVSLSAQFQRPEIRLMAQLKLAQGILAGPPTAMVSSRPYQNRER